jgi:hypothetical protein
MNSLTPIYECYHASAFHKAEWFTKSYDLIFAFFMLFGASQKKIWHAENELAIRQNEQARTCILTG